MTQQTELTALLIQGEPDKRRYRVYTQDDHGREKQREVEPAVFWAIHEAAGEPVYTEPGYWTYDNRPIEWDDVLPPRSAY